MICSIFSSSMPIALSIFRVSATFSPFPRIDRAPAIRRGLPVRQSVAAATSSGARNAALAAEAFAED